jgi:hypothetical protein
MAEAEPRGVQAQAAQRIPARPVEIVSHDRMAEPGQLDADLVTPSGAEPERHPRHVRPSLDHAIPGDRDARAAATRRGPPRVDGADAE